MIPVTKPFLPPKEDYSQYISNIWERRWLTNNGPLVNELELNLKDYLKVPHLLYLNNGTVALQIAIKALGLKGEIITTPFSYVATTSSIVWEGCSPVFVDIDSETFNIDPEKIEQAITANTTAILATHVFGNPCDIDKISTIAQKHKLKIIYDAAHCFGTEYKTQSVFAYGDISTTSFHATKLYHTIEGGAVFTMDKDVLKAMSLLRNFGHIGTESINGIGINGKNSEFHAAMGLLNLKHVNEILSKREKLSKLYDIYLRHPSIKHQKINADCKYNFSYYPVVFNSPEILLEVMNELNRNLIQPRRYFHPSLNTLDYVTPQMMPNSEFLAERILCLPLYHDLQKEEIDLISRLVLRVINNS